MKYLLYFALGALALRLLDILWQMVVGTPVVEYENLLHVCGDCGSELQIVRPGKYQCVECDGGMEFVVTYEGGGEQTTVTPPWFYETYWN